MSRAKELFETCETCGGLGYIEEESAEHFLVISGCPACWWRAMDAELQHEAKTKILEDGLTLHAEMRLAKEGQ
jgi:hypothetical protein